MPLQVLHVLKSEAWGGLELYTLTLIRKLLDEGVDSMLWCQKQSRVHTEALKLQLPLTTDPFFLFKKNQKLTHVHVHRRQDLPLIRFYLMTPSLSKVKFIYSLYMMAPPKKDLYHRWIYQRLDAVLTSSTWVLEEIKKNFPIENSRAYLVRYGRNESQKASPAEIDLVKNSLGTDSQKIIFGTACRIDPGKGIQELALALDHLSLDTRFQHSLEKLELWIIGEPTLLKTNTDGTPEYEPKSKELNEWLLKFQKKYPQTLKLIPFQKELHHFLSAMDIFILASHGETYSLAVIDAMMQGLPIIGTNSGGTPEQVQNRGLLVEPNNPEALAQAIHYLLDHNEERIQFSKAARDWSHQEHAWKKTIHEMKVIYEKPQ